MHFCVCCVLLCCTQLTRTQEPCEEFQCFGSSSHHETDPALLCELQGGSQRIHTLYTVYREISVYIERDRPLYCKDEYLDT